MRWAMKARKRRDDRSLGGAIAENGAESSRGTLLAAATIVVASVLVYSNTFGVPLLLFDGDGMAIVDNPTIRHLWPPGLPLSPPHSGSPVDGRPIVNLSFAVNYAISGLAPWSYHVVNLMVHVLAALALMGVIRRTLTLPGTPMRLARSATGLATVIALVWAIHPLQTESVTYISQRAEPLAALFFFLTLYCSIRSATSERSAIWTLAAVAACALGMGSKEVVVSAPLIVLLYDRAFLSGSFKGALKNRWELYVGLATTWLLLAALAVSSGERGGTVGFDLGIDWWDYLGTQGVAIVHYLKLCVWPDSLLFDYGTGTAKNALEIAVDAVVVGLLGLLSLVVLWRRPKVGLLGAWFFATLAPNSSVIPVATQTIAEHRMYLPLAAVATAIVTAGYVAMLRLAWRGTFSPRTLRATGGLLVVAGVAALGTLTFQRNRDYQTAISIWQDTVAKSPKNARAHNNLGSALAESGRLDEAIAEYHEALGIQSDYVEAYNNLGLVMSERGDLDKAAEYFRKALQADPGNARVLNNLGIVLMDCGQINEATAQFEKSLEIDRDFADAYSNLGSAAARRGRPGEAIAYYQMAINLKPDYLGACNDLAWLRATYPAETIRNGAQAVELAERLVEAAGGWAPNHLDTLAAAYAEAGRFSDAVQTAKKALDLATQQNNPAMAKTMRARIRLYQAGIPMREMPGDGGE